MGDQKGSEKSRITDGDKSNGDQAFSDRRLGLLAGWTATGVLALLGCVLGTLVLAWCVSKGKRPQGGCTEKGRVCHEEHYRSVSSRRPPSPPRDASHMTLVLNVAGGSVSQQVVPSTPPACPEGPQPAATVEAGPGAQDLIVVVDREKIVEKVRDKETIVETEKVETKEVVKPPPPSRPPEVCKQLVGRVHFEPGRCRVRFQRREVFNIADRLQGRTGTVLVVGHPDSGQGRRHAEHRAKRVGKALRTALKERPGTHLPVFTQAATMEQLGAGSTGSCGEVHYGTAGVYLIEGVP